MTAYGSLLRIGKPKAGETIFISAASGAVGQLVGQMAKRLGLIVIGSAGSDDKVKYLLDELKFDGALNYKDANFRKELEKLVPNGIDIYYENVGGVQLEIALDLAARKSGMKIGTWSWWKVSKKNITKKKTLSNRLIFFLCLCS